MVYEQFWAILDSFHVFDKHYELLLEINKVFYLSPIVVLHYQFHIISKQFFHDC